MKITLFCALVSVSLYAEETLRRRAPNQPSAERTVGNPRAGEIAFDLRKGVQGQTELQRLKALVFAINSLNTSGTSLLNTEDVLRANFRRGEIPKDGNAIVRLNLKGFLLPRQIETLSQILAQDPLSCDGFKDLQNGVSVESFVKAVFQPNNYYRLLGLNDSRADFERTVGVTPGEFDGDPRKRDGRATRVLIAPGDSGVVLPDGYRKLVIEKGRRGLVVRSEDVEKENAARADHDFSVNPVTAQGDAHEEIWELPNGFRAYALRNRAGALQTSAPTTIVSELIPNPIKCMKCHASGYIGTTGKFSERKLETLKRVSLNKEERGVEGLGELQYSTFEKYSRTIASANATLAGAVEDAKSLNTGGFYEFTEAVSTGVVPLTSLADQLDTSLDRVKKELTSGTFGNYQAEKDTLKFSDLERNVPPGKKSLFCELKSRIEASRVKERAKNGLPGDVSVPIIQAH